ncbi:hypothetical protein, partial [Alloprevotella sp. OH1205_COT-284]|uniref:hypothetical protein n=1 Tax=Alloprevotella sp. OH1205_COT-284 TaxID=2491043 RepID=UPI001F4035CD
IFHYSIINTSKGMKKRALCPLSGVHLTIKPLFETFFLEEATDQRTKSLTIAFMRPLQKPLKT